MLEAGDRIELCAGVRLDGDTIVDEVRCARFPANATARLVLERADVPLGRIATELGERYSIAPDRALADVLAFCWALNRALLINVRRSGSGVRRWLGLAVRLAPSGTLPPPLAVRSRVDGRSWRSVVGSVFCALRRRCVAIAAIALVPAWEVSSVSGWGIRGGLAIGCAAGLSVVAHEAGHALALRRCASAVVVSGLRTFVLHAALDPQKRARVAVAGPLAPTAIGLVLLVACSRFQLELLAVAACVSIAHSLCLTVATSDGRNGCCL
jgi:hypothetical protein